MDNDGHKVVWTVVIISAIAIIGLMFVNFMPLQTSNIKTAIGNELSAFGNVHKSDSSSSKSSSSNTAVEPSLLTGTPADWQSQSIDITNNVWCLQDGITVNVKKNTKYTAQSEIKSDVKTDTWHIEVWGYLNNTTSTYTILNHGQETNVNGSTSKVSFNSGDYTRVVIMPHVASLNISPNWSTRPTSKVVYWRHEKLEEDSNTTD